MTTMNTNEENEYSQEFPKPNITMAHDTCIVVLCTNPVGSVYIGSCGREPDPACYTPLECAMLFPWICLWTVGNGWRDRLSDFRGVLSRARTSKTICKATQNHHWTSSGMTSALQDVLSLLNRTEAWLSCLFWVRISTGRCSRQVSVTLPAWISQ